MDRIETLEAFYKRKYNWVPNSLLNEIGHFNVFNLEPPSDMQPKSLPYRRRDYFKVMLMLGENEILYADRIIKVEKQALVFSNPFIPYQCADLTRIEGGFFCIFNQHFFHQYGDLNQYSVFQPKGEHVFEVTDVQVSQIRSIYTRMFEEIGSNYLHKYDVLRNLVFELLHFAMKMRASTVCGNQPAHAAHRISTLFLELLERQFPIEENHPQMILRTASDFAQQLNIHTNHLNRALKTITKKTTSQIIAERILQEAKILLKNSYLSISDIAFALGFSEATHFNNFFKKHTQTSPLKFRNLPSKD